MKNKDEPTNPDVDRKKADDHGHTHRTGEGVTDIREANDNIRKSQGDDAGHPPVIDRHR